MTDWRHAEMYSSAAFHDFDAGHILHVDNLLTPIALDRTRTASTLEADSMTWPHSMPDTAWCTISGAVCTGRRSSRG